MTKYVSFKIEDQNSFIIIPNKDYHKKLINFVQNKIINYYPNLINSIKLSIVGAGELTKGENMFSPFGESYSLNINSHLSDSEILKKACLVNLYFFYFTTLENKFFFITNEVLNNYLERAFHKRKEYLHIKIKPFKENKDLNDDEISLENFKTLLEYKKLNSNMQYLLTTTAFSLYNCQS